MSEIPSLDPAAVRWSPDPDPRRPLLVMLHGYGADENDLFPLAEMLGDGFDVAAPRAPLAPPWPAPGASWYPIEGLDGRNPEAVTAAADRLLEWLDDAAPGRTLGLLGFSQGAAVSLQALRRAPERIAFVVNLSGYAAPGELDHDDLLRERRPPVFWGRGAQDTVIPAALIDHTVQWLPAHGELSGRVYPGLGHGISAEEVEDIALFVSRRLSALENDSADQG